jgi:hypothetical protein
MRSNKRYSQYGVDELKRYIAGTNNCRKVDQPYSVRASSTFNRSGEVEYITIGVHGSPVMQVDLDVKTRHPLSIMVFSGFYYDNNGNPSLKTTEILNSLLDFLGDEQIIPQDVRVIKRDEYGKILFYLSHKNSDNLIVLNKDYCNMIHIRPDKDNLNIINSDLTSSGNIKILRRMLYQET